MKPKIKTIEIKLTTEANGVINYNSSDKQLSYRKHDLTMTEIKALLKAIEILKPLLASPNS